MGLENFTTNQEANHSSVSEEEYDNLAQYHDALAEVIVNGLDSGIGPLQVYKGLLTQALKPIAAQRDESLELLRQRVARALYNDGYAHPLAGVESMKSSFLRESAKRKADWVKPSLSGLELKEHLEDELDSYSKYDSDADGWVYSLKVVRLYDDTTFYYSGKSERSELADRIRTHIESNGQFTMPAESVITEEDILVSANSDCRPELDIEPLNVVSCHKRQGESDEHFSKRVRELERINMLRLAFKYDTYNVLGGK